MGRRDAGATKKIRNKVSRPWAYFRNGPNVVALKAPALIRHWL